jgi:hypothetical protein
LADFHRGTWQVFIKALGEFLSRHLAIDEYSFSWEFLIEANGFRKNNRAILSVFCIFAVSKKQDLDELRDAIRDNDAIIN